MKVGQTATSAGSKPVRVKSPITGDFHYEYRGVKIQRWVNESGHYIGNTTMYNPAGVTFRVESRFPEETLPMSFDTLKRAVSYVDRRLTEAEWSVGSDGTLVFTKGA